MCQLGGRDHNATSYSTETLIPATVNALAILAEIITLRAIALKRFSVRKSPGVRQAEIITLRAIALKQLLSKSLKKACELAEIITLRAIALKRLMPTARSSSRAEIITLRAIALKLGPAHKDWRNLAAEIITLRAIALKRPVLVTVPATSTAEIITLRAIALKPGNGIVDGAQALQRS